MQETSLTECVPNSTVVLASVVEVVLDDKGADVSVDVGNNVCVVVMAVPVDVSAVVESTTIQLSSKMIVIIRGICTVTE